MAGGRRCMVFCMVVNCPAPDAAQSYAHSPTRTYADIERPMTAQPRILVADDDPAMCLLLRETLQEAGYEVLIAHDGDQLIRMAQDHPPDLLLIDLIMPLMDGFEAIRQLRNDTRTSHLPMIILTARSTSAEVVIGFDSGADDYIVKPYDIDVLLARIRSHLRRAAKLPVRNPLTGLPGNVLLQAEIERQIAQQTPFALIYVDLDNFKAFNDAYGFARGDRAIHTLASVLAGTAPRDDFLGHIGGDDFAIIHYGGFPEVLAQQIISAFDERVRALYDPEDLQRGYLQGQDRHGAPRQFGLLSLSISIVTSDGSRFHSVDEISKMAAEVKSAAKSIAGSSYVLDRRLTTMPYQQERRGQEHRGEQLRPRPAPDDYALSAGTARPAPSRRTVDLPARGVASFDRYQFAPAGLPLAHRRRCGAGPGATGPHTRPGPAHRRYHRSGSLGTMAVSAHACEVHRCRDR